MALNYSYSGNWYSYTSECVGTFEATCPNPFYNAPLNFEMCDALMCDSERIPGGFDYGRKDIIARHGSLIIFILVLMSFGLNHTIYLWRKKQNEI